MGWGGRLWLRWPLHCPCPSGSAPAGCLTRPFQPAECPCRHRAGDKALDPGCHCIPCHLQHSSSGCPSYTRECLGRLPAEHPWVLGSPRGARQQQSRALICTGCSDGHPAWQWFSGTGMSLALELPSPHRCHAAPGAEHPPAHQHHSRPPASCPPQAGDWKVVQRLLGPCPSELRGCAGSAGVCLRFSSPAPCAQQVPTG